MCEQTEISYLDGDVVWVKLGPCWWPGEIWNEDRLPDTIKNDTGKKKPLAIVKFFNEESYEFVKNLNHIYKYNCTKKNDFIKKGLDQQRSKNKYMENFTTDLRRAEELTGGDPDIADSPLFQPEVKVDYAHLFRTPDPKKKKKMKTPKSAPSGISSTNKKQSAWNTSVPGVSGLSKSFATKRTPITHPRFLNKGKSEYQSRILMTSESCLPTTPGFNCSYGCSFTTQRLNNMIMHNKQHIHDIKEQTSGSVKKPAMTSTPKTSKDSTTPKGSKEKTPRKRKTVDASIKLLPVADLVEKSLSRKRGRPKKSEKEVKPFKNEKKQKTETEIRKDLLADWSEDSDDEKVKEIEQKIAETAESEVIQIIVEAQSPDTTTVSFTEEVNKDGVAEPDVVSDNITTAMETNANLLSRNINESSKDGFATTKAVFDFSEDDDPEILHKSPGRKIPRVLNKKTMKEFEYNVDSDNDACKFTESSKGSSGIEADSSTAEGPSSKPSVNESNDKEYEEEIKSLLDETALPELPSVPTSLKMESNFPESKAVKFPDKREIMSPKERGKRIFKSRQIFKNKMQQQLRLEKEMKDKLEYASLVQNEFDKWHAELAEYDTVEVLQVIDVDNSKSDPASEVVCPGTGPILSGEDSNKSSTSTLESLEISSPVKEKLTSPVKDKPTSPVKEKPTSPVKEKPTSPMKEKLTSPVKEKPTSPVKEKPTSPVKEKPTSPVKEKPTSPMKEKPTSPVKEKPTSPMKEKPTSPVKEKPTNISPKVIRKSPRTRRNCSDFNDFEATAMSNLTTNWKSSDYEFSTDNRTSERDLQVATTLTKENEPKSAPEEQDEKFVTDIPNEACSRLEKTYSIAEEVVQNTEKVNESNLNAAECLVNFSTYAYTETAESEKCNDKTRDNENKKHEILDQGMREQLVTINQVLVGEKDLSEVSTTHCFEPEFQSKVHKMDNYQSEIEESVLEDQPVSKVQGVESAGNDAQPISEELVSEFDQSKIVLPNVDTVGPDSGKLEKSIDFEQSTHKSKQDSSEFAPETLDYQSEPFEDQPESHEHDNVTEESRQIDSESTRNLIDSDPVSPEYEPILGAESRTTGAVASDSIQLDAQVSEPQLHAEPQPQEISQHSDLLQMETEPTIESKWMIGESEPIHLDIESYIQESQPGLQSELIQPNLEAAQIIHDSKAQEDPEMETKSDETRAPGIHLQESESFNLQESEPNLDIDSPPIVLDSTPAILDSKPIIIDSTTVSQSSVHTEPIATSVQIPIHSNLESEPILTDSKLYSFHQASDQILQDSESRENSEEINVDIQTIVKESKTILEESEPIIRDSEPILHDSEEILHDFVSCKMSEQQSNIPDSEPFVRESELVQASELNVQESEPLVQEFEPLVLQSKPVQDMELNVQESEPLVLQSKPVQDMELNVQESEPLVVQSKAVQDTELNVQESEPLVLQSKPVQEPELNVQESEPLLQESEPLVLQYKPVQDTELNVQESEPLVQESELKDSEPIMPDSEQVAYDFKPIVRDSELIPLECESILDSEQHAMPENSNLNQNKSKSVSREIELSPSKYKPYKKFKLLTQENVPVHEDTVLISHDIQPVAEKLKQKSLEPEKRCEDVQHVEKIMDATTEMAQELVQESKQSTRSGQNIKSIAQETLPILQQFESFSSQKDARSKIQQYEKIPKKITKLVQENKFHDDLACDAESVIEKNILYIDKTMADPTSNLQEEPMEIEPEITKSSEPDLGLISQFKLDTPIPQKESHTSNSRLLDMLAVSKPPHTEMRTSFKQKPKLRIVSNKLLSPGKEFDYTQFTDQKNAQFVIKMKSETKAKVVTPEPPRQGPFDLEDIQTFIIEKPKNLLLNAMSGTTPVTVSTSTSVITPTSVLTSSSGVTATSVITSPASPVKQTRAPIKILRKRISKPKPPNVELKSIEKKNEDTVFDINSMPIVLSNEILTPENIDNMPIIMSDSLMPGNVSNEGNLVLDTSNMVLDSTNFIIMDQNMVDAKQDNSTIKKAPQKTPTMRKAQPKQYISRPSTDKAVITKIQPQKPSPKYVSPPTHGNLVLGRNQKVYQSPAQTQILKTDPSVITQQGKPGKFIVLPSSTSGTGTKYTVGKRGQKEKQTVATTSKTVRRPNQDASGNTIMILTNAQGVQSKVVLTPEQQHLLFPNQKLTATKAAALNISQSQQMLKGSAVSNKQKALVNQIIVTSKGQILPNEKTGVSVKNVETVMTKLVPNSSKQKNVFSSISQTMITSKGQLITPTSTITSTGQLMQSPQPVMSKGNLLTPLTDTQLKQFRGAKSQPKLQMHSQKVLVSAKKSNIISNKIISQTTKQLPQQQSSQIQQPVADVQKPVQQLVARQPAAKPQTQKSFVKLTAAQLEEMAKLGYIEEGENGGKLISPKGLRYMNLMPDIRSTPTVTPKNTVPRVTKRTLPQQHKRLQIDESKTSQAAGILQSRLMSDSPNVAQSRTLLLNKQESMPPLAPISAGVEKARPAKNQRKSNYGLNRIPDLTELSLPNANINSQSNVLEEHVAEKQKDEQENVLQQVVETPVLEDSPKQPVATEPVATDAGALGNIPDGQLLAVPGENFGGPPNSFFLCSVEDNGNLTPIDNQPLYLDANNQLVPGSTVPEIVSQLEPVESGLTDQTETILQTPLTDLLQSDVDNQIIINADGQQIILDQASLLALTEQQILTTDGTQLILQGNAQQILEALAAHQEMNLVREQSLLGNDQFGGFANQESANKDILAAALANTDVFQSEAVAQELVDPLSYVDYKHCNVAETSSALTQPIMTPLEVPSKTSKLDIFEHGKIDNFTQNLEESLAVIGVNPSTIPTSLDLPITITNPKIAPKTTNPLNMSCDMLYQSSTYSHIVSVSKDSSSDIFQNQSFMSGELLSHETPYQHMPSLIGDDSDIDKMETDKSNAEDAENHSEMLHLHSQQDTVKSNIENCEIKTRLCRRQSLERKINDVERFTDHLSLDQQISDRADVLEEELQNAVQDHRTSVSKVFPSHRHAFGESSITEHSQVDSISEQLTENEKQIRLNEDVEMNSSINVHSVSEANQVTSISMPLLSEDPEEIGNHEKSGTYNLNLDKVSDINSRMHSEEDLRSGTPETIPESDVGSPNTAISETYCSDSQEIPIQPNIIYNRNEDSGDVLDHDDSLKRRLSEEKIEAMKESNSSYLTKRFKFDDER